LSRREPAIKRRPSTKSGPLGAPERRAANELALLGLSVAALAGAAMKLHVFDRVIASTSSSDLNLNGLLALLVLVPVATTVFARRRYKEALSVRAELVRLSLHDALTGLPNRMLLADWLAADIQASQRHNSQAGVLFVDLDKFKHVNDTHGHEVGDRLMRAVAERLRTMLRPEDRVIRFGGDEFVILCPEVNSAAAGEKIAQRVIEIIEQPFTIGDETMRISASVGVALAEHRGVKPEEVLRDADVAMYQAKALGSGHVTVFDRSMTGTLTPATAEEQIRDALEAGEFHLHYQPVVELASGRIVGAEALLRWISPNRGTISPAEFIPILEETGLIVPVGTWVLEEACREAARVATLLDGSPPVTITVNVSARQLAQVDFGDKVANAMRSAGVGPGQIHLEITEGALMHDVSSAWTVLRQAKALGVKLALDDFGTGYSSLSYVRRFSLDMLKVDKSFIDGIDSSPEDRAIVEHVVGMAQALGMVTVAEGVERPEQLQWLRRLGCKLAQGYAMSRPIPGQDFEAILAKREIDPFNVVSGDRAPAAAAASPAATPRPNPAPGLGPAASVDGSAPAAPPAPRVAPPLAPVAPPAHAPLSPAASAAPGGPAAGPLTFAPPGASEMSPLETPMGSIDPSNIFETEVVPVAAAPSAAPALPRLREYRPSESDDQR
jgi:diguanylate cyclase (GGDEF)-like protein